MEKKLQNPTSNKNETPTPQGGKWPDETIIRYIIRAFLLLIVFTWALVNLDAVLCFLGKVLALFFGQWNAAGTRRAAKLLQS